MSLKNILNENTENEEWATLYSKSLTCKTLNSKNIPMSETLGNIRYSGPGGALQGIPAFPSFVGLQNVNTTNSDINPLYYEIGPLDQLIILKAGRYNISAFIQVSLTLATTQFYLKLAVNGLPLPEGNVQSSASTVANTVICLQLNENIVVTDNNTVQLIVSNGSGLVNVSVQKWKISVSRLEDLSA